VSDQPGSAGVLSASTVSTSISSAMASASLSEVISRRRSASSKSWTHSASVISFAYRSDSCRSSSASTTAGYTPSNMCSSVLVSRY